MLFNFKELEGVSWADYFLKDEPKQSVFVQEDTFDDNGWEPVGKPKKAENTMPVRWCRDGNACPWINCKFRHERCSHYDNWVKRGKKGNNCRCFATDPDSNKSQKDGGCMYDHRDPKKLKVFVETLPVKTESQMWDYFMEKGLELHISDVLDPREMTYMDRCLLIRSLKASDVYHEDHGDHIIIFYPDE